MMNQTLDGAWELLGGWCEANGETLHYDRLGIRSRKLLGDGHFSFISHRSDRFWAAGSGRYTFDGAQYTEYPDMGTFTLEDLRPYAFRARLSGRDWYNERWEDGRLVEYEHWRRLGL